jgi:hypothetical protein
MEIKKLDFNGEYYYYVNEYSFKYGTFYKFATIDEKVIFCEKNDDKYIPVVNKKLIKKLNKEFPKIEIKDIV